MAGSATGIGMLHAGDPDAASAGGALSYRGEVVAADSPSWLAAHPRLPVVYAVAEHRQQVQAFSRTGEATYVALGEPVDAGEAVCHVAVSPDGGYLVASCWGDGRVVRIGVDAAGRPRTPMIAPAATDPYDAAGGERQSRAHQALFLPGGLVATTDLGYDLVRFWRDGGDGLRAAQQVALPRGTGPRHMVWHPSGHLYVVTELSCEVFAMAPAADGSWRVVGGSPLGALPRDAAAELSMSRDGEFLYAGVRGSNTVATLRVRGAGESLAPVALADVGVDWPRHHLVARDTLLVAGQRSNEVAALTLDLRTGVPGRARRRVDAPSPTCLLPVRG